MPFDFKQAYKELYRPKATPNSITVPPANFIALRGKGDPNEEGGAYKQAVGVLYALAYTLKMSHLSHHEIEGYFAYVVPPLEGFWWQEGVPGIDYANKAGFHWVSLIRLPDFVKKTDFDWAAAEAEKKKKIDCSQAEFLTVDEGLCVQMLHIGPYDDEPKTLEAMNAYILEKGLEADFSPGRFHHEIYLSDPRKTERAKMKTIIRHPVKRVQ